MPVVEEYVPEPGIRDLSEAYITEFTMAPEAGLATGRSWPCPGSVMPCECPDIGEPTKLDVASCLCVGRFLTERIVCDAPPVSPDANSVPDPRINLSLRSGVPFVPLHAAHP